MTDGQKGQCVTSAKVFQDKARDFDKDAKIDYLAAMFGLSVEETRAVKGFLQVRLGKLLEDSKDALLVGAML